MKAIFVVAVTAVLYLSTLTEAKLPDNFKDTNLISQTKNKFSDYFKTLERQGIEGLFSRVENEAKMATVDFFLDRYKNFNFNLKEFQIGMGAGVLFGVLEFAFRNVFPTWSWMGYTYKLTLDQSPATLFTILSKIGLEVFHQFDITQQGHADVDFGYFDVALSAISIPILLLVGNQSYLLGLALIEFGKQVAIIKHPHWSI